MSGKSVCKGDHSCHLCKMIKKMKIKEIKPLVNNPKHICHNCGRVANDEKYLCDPESI